MSGFTAGDFSGNGGTTTFISWPKDAAEVIEVTGNEAPVHHVIPDDNRYAVSIVDEPFPTDAEFDA